MAFAEFTEFTELAEQPVNVNGHETVGDWYQ